MMKKAILSLLLISVFALAGANNAGALPPSGFYDDCSVDFDYKSNSSFTTWLAGRDYVLVKYDDTQWAGVYQGYAFAPNGSATLKNSSSFVGGNFSLPKYGIEIINSNGMFRIDTSNNSFSLLYNMGSTNTSLIFRQPNDNGITDYSFACLTGQSRDDFITVDSSFTDPLPSILHNVIDVDYQVNMNMQGSGSNLIANYSGFTTTPNSPDIQEIESIRWGIIDTNVIDDQSTVGYKFVCNQLDLSKTQAFQSDCTGYTPIQGHIYHLIAGVYFGNATQEANINGQDYFITYKMASIVIPLFQQGTYSNDTITCDSQSLGGDYGFGTGCNTQTTDFITVFNHCITTEFPFLDINQCTKLFSSGFQLLTFQKVTFGNDWATDNVNCRQLDTLDNWLGLPENYTICPQFPGYIRDTITPFVTFFLGLLTITFVANRGSNI